MLKLYIKHFVYEQCLDIVFKHISINFNNPMLSMDDKLSKSVSDIHKLKTRLNTLYDVRNLLKVAKQPLDDIDSDIKYLIMKLQQAYEDTYRIQTF